MQLLDILAPVELLRGLLFAVANCNDLAVTGDKTAQALAGWLLPIIKTSGGEIAFEAASGAIQVLGGAGYTAEWPIEQALRDARVLTIFEGTTGIQSLDLVHRRLLADDTGYVAFLREARALGEPRLTVCINELEAAAQWLREHPSAVDAGATAFLHLAANAALSWIAAGYVDAGIADQTLGIAGEHWLDTAPARAVFLHRAISTGSDRAKRFNSILA